MTLLCHIGIIQSLGSYFL